MDDTEDDARYPPNTCRAGDDYGSSDNQKRPAWSAPDPRHVGDQYGEDDDEDSDDEAEFDDNIGNGVQVQQIGKDESSDTDDEDDFDTDSGDTQRNQKKRKLKSLLSSYEFVPRAPAAAAAGVAAPKASVGGRNPLADWSEHETFVLLDAWGDRFLKQGRKSLRSEEWQEVAKKVSQESKIKRTDTQCRNRLDTLKKKYKKEKTKLAETRSVTGRWVYFRKMDLLLSSSNQQQGGLSCGLDSGEYVLTNPKSHLSRANELDEMRDSPGISVSADAEDNSEGLPPKRTKKGKRGADGGSSFKLLADSIHKFSEIYEKIEDSKRQQMLELEKMRMDFHRELEAQKRQILERAKAEIAKIRQGDYEENNGSAENASG
ncbi:PREDICTED: trihelix transcription factor ASIL1-like [Ipomoea nil]|uniref:trihelix transcription factor ASIL1-like n=1 Tax=Ipomoea nil TaxID=35883 RepID=UPI000900C0FA|nr:PREDICTED: trihelix transcription factor ASIL1-like [Ipomoea nil]